MLKQTKNPVALFFLAILLFPPEIASARPLTDPSNKHNLSSAATPSTRVHAELQSAGGTTEICVFCHTPHGASPQSTLWNRKDPGGMGTFPMYGGQLVIKGDYPGSPEDANTHSQYGGSDYPNGASKMCLSCHDGNTAQIGELFDGTGIQMVNLGNFPDTAVVDLTNSHPISFIYDTNVLGDLIAARGDNTYQLPDPATDPVAHDVPLDGRNRMQCTTCHDPHEDTRDDPAVGLPFWRHNTGIVVDPYDDVCNTCHIAPTTVAPGTPHGL